MKKVDIDRIFNKLSLQVRSTGHNYGWLTVSDKKVLRVHYSHGKGDLPDKIMHKILGQLKLSEKDFKDLVACPACRSYGRTINEALENIQEAIEVCLLEESPLIDEQMTFVGVRDIEMATQ